MTDINKNAILEAEKIPQRNLKDTDVLVEEIINMIKSYSPDSNTDTVYIAYRLAKSLHEGQKRKSGDPYIVHPVEVAYIAAQLSLDTMAITACLLHDVVEDTNCSREQIEDLFGPQVAGLVDGVTKLKQIKYSSHEEAQVENLRKMFFAMAKDIRVIVIKLIDRLHNMRTMGFMPPHKQLRISKETLDVYAPLAHRLGMSKIKIELEDLSLKYLDPVAYEEIRESINLKKSARDKYIADIMNIFRQKLEETPLPATVSLPVKTAVRVAGKQKIKTDTGIEISVPAELFSDPDCIEFTKEVNGTTTITIKGIHKISSRS